MKHEGTLYEQQQQRQREQQQQREQGIVHDECSLLVGRVENHFWQRLRTLKRLRREHFVQEAPIKSTQCSLLCQNKFIIPESSSLPIFHMFRFT